ncbi:MAG TPA: TrbC/VirB2 family protein [Burkholderiaceae bacterium]
MISTLSRGDSRDGHRLMIQLGLLLLFAGLWMLAGHASASTTGGGGAGLPWETPLSNLSKSVSGPVAFAIATIAIVVAGGVLIFGGDLNGFFRSLVFLVLVIAVIVCASNVLKGLSPAGAQVGVAAPAEPPVGLA